MRDRLSNNLGSNSQIREVVDLQIHPEIAKKYKVELDLKNPTDQRIAANIGVVNLANIIKTLNNYSEDRGEGLKKILTIYQRLQFLKRSIEQIKRINPEIANQIIEWTNLITELVKELSQDPKIQKIIYSKEFVSEIVKDRTKYEERFNNLLKSKKGQEFIKHYLLPENVERLSDEIVFEYLQTVTEISRDLMILRISKPSKGKITFTTDKEGRVKSESSSEIELKAINIEQVKTRLRNVYSQAENLKLPKDRIILEKLDQEVYEIVGDLVNRLIRDFPYPDYKVNRYANTKDEIFNIYEWDYKISSSIRNVLESSRAICNGQVTMLSLLFEKLDLKNYSCMVNGHIFSEVELPSKRRILIDPINHDDINNPQVNLGHFEIIEEVFPKSNDQLFDGTNFFNWDLLAPEEKRRYMLRREGDGKNRYFVPVNNFSRNNESDEAYQYYDVLECSEIIDVLDSMYVSLGNYQGKSYDIMGNKTKSRGERNLENEIRLLREPIMYSPLNESSKRKLNSILNNLIKEYLEQPNFKKLISIILILIKLNQIEKVFEIIDTQTNLFILKQLKSNLKVKGIINNPSMSEEQRNINQKINNSLKNDFEESLEMILTYIDIRLAQ